MKRCAVLLALFFAAGAEAATIVVYPSDDLANTQPQYDFFATKKNVCYPFYPYRCGGERRVYCAPLAKPFACPYAPDLPSPKLQFLGCGGSVQPKWDGATMTYTYYCW